MSNTPTLTHSIGQAENALRAILDHQLAATQLTYAQWVTLSVIARNGSAVPHDQLIQRVSGVLKLGAPTVTATLGELIARGLVTTSAGGGPIVSFTANGDAQFHSLRLNIELVTARLLGDLSPAELATTQRVLSLITERANAELRGDSKK